MNYILIFDLLWYTGHILSGISIIFTKNYYYLAISMVFFGQFITIISRPISRIKSHKISEIKDIIDENIINKENIV